jgi:hypothetical protein
MKSPGRIFWLVSVLACCGTLTRGVQAQAISTVSPFLPRGGNAGVVTENSPVELRGIMPTEGGPTFFGLYDPIKKQCSWVKLNEVGRDLPATVRTYDASSETITVDYQGRTLNLALKAAKIETAPAMAQIPQLQPRPMPGPQLNPVPAVDEAKRLEAVAAEVARRRQQRQAAMQQTMPPGQGQPMQNAPVQPQLQPQPLRPGNGIGGR